MRSLSMESHILSNAVAISTATASDLTRYMQVGAQWVVMIAM